MCPDVQKLMCTSAGEPAKKKTSNMKLKLKRKKKLKMEGKKGKLHRCRRVVFHFIQDAWSLSIGHHSKTVIMAFGMLLLFYEYFLRVFINLQSSRLTDWLTEIIFCNHWAGIWAGYPGLNEDSHPLGLDMGPLKRFLNVVFSCFRIRKCFFGHI